MATMITKTDHPFTRAQLTTLNNELKKISPAQVALSGTTLPGKGNFIDIEVKHSPFMLDVFLHFTDITDPERPKSYVYGISPAGVLDKEVRATLDFKTLADRVSFFNSLEPINFY